MTDNFTTAGSMGRQRRSIATAEVDGPQAEVSADLLDGGGWEIAEYVSERVYEEKHYGRPVHADAHTTNYENADLRDRLAEDTMGNVETELMFFLAMWVEFDHPVGRSPDSEDPTGDIEEEATDAFIETLEDSGVEAIEESGERTIEIDAGYTATVTDYVGEYRFGDLEFAVAGDRSLTVEGDAIDVGATIAVWDDDEDVFVGAGAHPAENYARSIRETIVEGIEFELDVDLGLTPDAYSADIDALIRSIDSPE